MRLSKPEGLSNNFKRLLKPIAVILLLLLIAIAIFIFHKHRNDQKNSEVLNANDALIQSHAGSNDINDKRTTIAAYEAKGDYSSALAIAEQVASQTKTYQDYMAVLLICGVHDVSNKSGCVSATAKNLQPIVSKMPFASAYSAAVVIEKNNLKKESVNFYQRAYDTYNPDPNAENMMSKDQLKAHIDELSK